MGTQVVRQRVYHVAQEHWHLRNSRCRCGGSWAEVGPQRLHTVDGVPHDAFDALCRACGGVTAFLFDVSSFFAHREQTAEWVRAHLPLADEHTRDAIEHRIGPPLMMRLSSFLSTLAHEGDEGTLRFVESIVRAALEDCAHSAGRSR